MTRDSADRLLQEAYTAHQSSQSELAERLYKKLLRLAPRDSDGRNLLGLLYIELERFDEAAQQIRRAMTIRPGDPHSHYNLGAALMGMDAPSEAADNFAEALAIDPNNNETRNALSAALNTAGAHAAESGQIEEALQYYTAAIEHDPDNAKAILNCGNLQEQFGDFDDASNSFKAAIAAHPEFADAHFQLAHLKHHISTQEEIDAMSALFENGGLDSRDYTTLAHGIAKANEKLLRYADEFRWLRKAHDIKRSFEPFDEAAAASRFRSLKDIFTTEAIAKGNADGGANLIFIVGMPRSGTSLAEQILASHSEIHGAGEVIAVADLNVSPSTPPREFPQLASTVTKTIAAQASEEIFNVETTPTNFLHLGKISLLFPEAKIVHCRRDAMDTCLSIYQHPLSAAHAYAHDLVTLGNYYREYELLMQHWEQVVPNPILTLQYESLVSDFEPTVRTLVEFCGADFEERCLRFYETRRQVKTPSASQVRQPIYQSSVGRWRRYERELEPLRSVLVQD
jgi:Tfp pilus assembly protein PilF